MKRLRLWLFWCPAAGAAAAPPPRLGWVINAGYVAAVQKVAHPTGRSAPSGAELADHFFNGTQSIIFTNAPGTNPLPAGYRAQAGMKFPGYAGSTRGFHGFLPTLEAGQIDPHITVVMYDNESWRKSGQTPLDEMAAPARFTAEFAAKAHAHHYAFVAVPSRDLMQGQPNYPGRGTLDDYYFTVDRAPTWCAAAPAEYYGIQMQVHQSDGTYAPRVAAAIAQALAANGALKIIPVLSTNYGTAADMCQAVLQTAALPHVWGYWINLAGPHGPQEIVDFLSLLRSAGD